MLFDQYEVEKTDCSYILCQDLECSWHKVNCMECWNFYGHKFQSSLMIAVSFFRQTFFAKKNVCIERSKKANEANAFFSSSLFCESLDFFPV